MTDLRDIRELHDRLYGRYLEERGAVLAEGDAFEREVNALLESMERAAAGANTLEDWEWLRGAAERWRAAFATTLKIPRDVALPLPGKPLRPAARPPGMIWADGDLEGWLRHRAYEMAKARALRRFQPITADELLRRAPSTREEQMQDWHGAAVELACEVFDGRIGLAQIRPGSYYRLERCWLDEVKSLKAYYIWLDRGEERASGSPEADYFQACDQVHARLCDPGARRPAAEFGPVRDYLESEYFTDGQLDSRKAERLVSAKAHRLWAKRGERDRAANWSAASAYAAGFYGNIVQAVESGDAEAARRVAAAVAGREPFAGLQIAATAFEATVAACFVDAAAFQSVQPATAAAGA